MSADRRKKMRRQLLAQWDGRCAYCDRLLKPRTATMDHIVPASQNGALQEMNLVICCWNCNQAKRDRTPEQWAADILAIRARRADSFLHHNQRNEP